MIIKLKKLLQRKGRKKIIFQSFYNIAVSIFVLRNYAILIKAENIYFILTEVLIVL